MQSLCADPLHSNGFFPSQKNYNCTYSILYMLNCGTYETDDKVDSQAELRGVIFFSVYPSSESSHIYSWNVWSVRFTMNYSFMELFYTFNANVELFFLPLYLCKCLKKIISLILPNVKRLVQFMQHIHVINKKTTPISTHCSILDLNFTAVQTLSKYYLKGELQQYLDSGRWAVPR